MIGIGGSWTKTASNQWVALWSTSPQTKYFIGAWFISMCFPSTITLSIWCLICFHCLIRDWEYVLVGASSISRWSWTRTYQVRDLGPGESKTSRGFIVSECWEGSTTWGINSKGSTTWNNISNSTKTSVASIKFAKRTY